MKRALICLVVTFCVINFAHADPTIRSLQQTLKDQGFYYGAVTGEKSAETTAAIRRYQIRNGLRVTGELNDETLRSVKSSSNSVAAESRPDSKPAVSQPSSGGPDVNARVSQSSPAPSFNEPNRPLEINQSHAASLYQSAPIRVNRRIIAGAQYQLMSRGFYRGRVDGKYGRQMAFALRAFQSDTGLPPTGRLDTATLEALGSSDADPACSARASGGYETWMPVRKFKHGKWKVKWKRYHRPFNGEDGDEDRQVNSQSRWNPYTEDY
jgi:peptidoglycan hydrolase-like protein with peptidoglycan-binding domain